MVERTRHVRRLQQLLRQYPVVAILGARQVGKTTLARRWRRPGKRCRRRSSTSRMQPTVHGCADPGLALRRLRGLVVLDEIQRRPDLFPVLRVLADRPRVRARFLVLGSASPDLLRQTSESLAGRIAYHELAGFALDEVGAAKSVDRLWLRGRLPALVPGARPRRQSSSGGGDFVRTFLERDLPQLGIAVPAADAPALLVDARPLPRPGLERVRVRPAPSAWPTRPCAATWTSWPPRSSSGMLQPWHENLGKRQVKSPKVYVADSGLLHALLGIETLEAPRAAIPRSAPRGRGSLLRRSCERLGRAARRVLLLGARTPAPSWICWSCAAAARLGFEFKRTEAPALTPSMRSALQDLKLDHARRDPRRQARRSRSGRGCAPWRRRACSRMYERARVVPLAVCSGPDGVRHGVVQHRHDVWFRVCSGKATVRGRSPPHARLHRGTGRIAVMLEVVEDQGVASGAERAPHALRRQRQLAKAHAGEPGERIAHRRAHGDEAALARALGAERAGAVGVLDEEAARGARGTSSARGTR